MVIADVPAPKVSTMVIPVGTYLLFIGSFPTENYRNMIVLPVWSTRTSKQTPPAQVSHSFGLYTAGLDERAEDAAGDGSVIARSEKGKGVQANEEHVRASTADAGRGR